MQWDNHSRELQANVRIDWIHTPGSDFFVVIDTGLPDRRPARRPAGSERTEVVKLTYLKGVLRETAAILADAQGRKSQQEHT